MDCPICCDAYNLRARRRVDCQYCAMSACAECVCRFMLDSHDDPRCMSPTCGKPWIHEFLARNLTKAFLGGAYLKHREAVLYGRELGYMPATQVEIEKDRRVAEIEKRIGEVRDASTEALRRRNEALNHMWFLRNSITSCQATLMAATYSTRAAKEAATAKIGAAAEARRTHAHSAMASLPTETGAVHVPPVSGCAPGVVHVPALSAAAAPTPAAVLSAAAPTPAAVLSAAAPTPAAVLYAAAVLSAGSTVVKTAGARDPAAWMKKAAVKLAECRRVEAESTKALAAAREALETSSWKTQYGASQRELQESVDLISTLRRTIRQVRFGEDVADADAPERRAFVRACPADGCKGFLSTAWKCGVCAANVCKDCHEVVSSAQGASTSAQGASTSAQGASTSAQGASTSTQAPHVCNPETLATAKLLAKDTKTCPTCACRIFKIDGCDQMFCVQCKTAFSWTTGRVVTNGRIHNPHYYDWLRSSSATGDIPREAGDYGPPRGCGEPDDRLTPRTLYDARRLMAQLRAANVVDTDSFYDVHRLLIHVRDVELFKYREVRPVDVEANMAVRKRYMRGEIDEPRLKALLQQREKKRYKDHEYNQVLSMFCQVAGEGVVRFCRRATAANEDLVATLDDLRRLRDYVNESLRAIGKRFNCVSPCIDARWTMTTAPP
jgi:hypothetical protein